MAKKLRSLSPTRTFDTFWVMINLSGPRYWKISKNGIEKTGAPARNEGPVISFDEVSDFRVAYQKNGSIKQATKYLLTEKQEKCRVFAGPKMSISSSSYVPYYGTPIARIEQFEHRVFPSSYFIDQLLMRHKIKLSEDRIVGFKFQTADEDFSIVVLYAVHPNGEISDPQISLNPPEMDIVLRDYAQQNNVDNFEPILFGIDEITKLPMGIGYPVEPMIGTTPVRYITSMIAMSFLGLSGVSFAYSGYLKLSIEGGKKDVLVANANAKKAREKVENLIQSKLPQLAERTSIQYGKGFEYVTKIYNPESKVQELLMTRENGVILITLPIVKFEKVLPYKNVDDLLNKELPAGLERQDILLGSDSNDYKIKYKFQTLDSDLYNVVGSQ